MGAHIGTGRSPDYVDRNSLGKNGQQFVPSMKNVEFDTACCLSCGKAHFRLLAKPFTKPNPPFTHFFLCPNNHEPAMLTIVEHDSKPLELHSKAMRDIAQHQGRSSLFAVISVKANGGVSCTVHRNDFPFALYDTAIEQFTLALNKVRPTGAPTEPLKPAGADRLALFGRGGTIEKAVQSYDGAPIAADAACAVETAGEVPPVSDEETSGDKEPESDEEN